MRLAEFCDIRSGYTARGRLDPLSEGGVPALQLRDVGTTGEPPGPDFQRYDLEDLHDRYFVHGGEVVFRSRGEPNTAVAVGDPLPEPVAVIVPLVIVRPNRERVLPEYLAWAINQPGAQRQLGAEAQGQNLRMIPLSALKSLDIAVPDLACQRRIVDLSTLARREQHLMRKLADRRAQYLSAILGEAAQAAEQKEIAR